VKKGNRQATISKKTPRSVKKNHEEKQGQSNTNAGKSRNREHGSYTRNCGKKRKRGKQKNRNNQTRGDTDQHQTPANQMQRQNNARTETQKVPKIAQSKKSNYKVGSGLKGGKGLNNIKNFLRKNKSPDRARTSKKKREKETGFAQKAKRRNTPEPGRLPYGFAGTD